MITKKYHSRPIPQGAAVVTKKGVRYAEWSVNDRKRAARLNDTGTGIITESKRWYIIFTDTFGKRHEVQGYTDRTATEQLSADLVKRAERGEAGLIDPHGEHKRRPIEAHLVDFESYLGNKDNTLLHVDKTLKRCRAIVEGIHAKAIGDITSGAVSEYLAERRRGGLSIESSNHYYRAIRGFCRWLCRDKRLVENPLAGLTTLKPDRDRKHLRRPLSTDELTRIVQVAQTGPERAGLSGPDRAMLYLVAAYSGLRVSELASLKPENFDAEAGIIRVAAGCTKNREVAEQPLPADLWGRLLPWLANKPKGQAVWPATKEIRRNNQIFVVKWYQKAADMLYFDLDRAGIESVDVSDRHIDFHALRHTYITNLARSGVHPRTAQALARHKTPNLTMQVYTHVLHEDLQTAVDKLPALPPGEKKTEAAVLAATGTDGKDLDDDNLDLKGAQKGAFRLAFRVGIWHNLTKIGKMPIQIG